MASVDWQKTNVPIMARRGKHFDNRKREKSNHKNEDINKELTKDNYYLGCKDWNDLLKKAKGFINETDKLFPPKKKQDQNERITMVALEIPCPRIITEQGRSEEFFELTNGLLASKFAGYSGMAVHVDEVHEYIDGGQLKTSCEHGHAFTPAYAEWEQKTKKGVEQRQGINGKNFVTRQAMIELNNAMNDLCIKNFGIPYNTGEKANKKTVEELKRGEYKELKKEISNLKKEKIKKQRENLQQENEIESIKSELNYYHKEIDKNREELEKINDNLEIKKEEYKETFTAVNELEKKGDFLHTKLTEKKEEFEFIKTESQKLKFEIESILPQYQLNKEQSQDFVDSIHTIILNSVYAGRKIEKEKMEGNNRDEFINSTVQKQFQEIAPTLQLIQNNNNSLRQIINEKITSFKKLIEKKKEEKILNKNLDQIHYADYFKLFFDKDGKISEKSEKYLEKEIVNIMYKNIDNQNWKNVQKIYFDLDEEKRTNLVDYIKKDCVRNLRDYNSNEIEMKREKFRNHLYRQSPNYSRFGSGLLQKLKEMNDRNLEGYER